MVMILRYDGDLITWFLYDDFMFWVVDLVIDGIMVHDILVWWFVYGVGFYHDL